MFHEPKNILDILTGIIYRLDKDTTLSTLYLEELLQGLERDEISHARGGALVEGYLKALFDMGALDSEYWETASDKVRAVTLT